MEVYKSAKTKSGGVIHLLPLIVIGALITAVVAIPFLGKSKQNQKEDVSIVSTPVVEPIESATPTPTFEPTPSPTPTFTPTPVVTPKPTATPTPSIKPITGPPGAGLTYATVHTEKGDFKATILSVDLNSARMITDTGNDGDCGTGCAVMPLASYITRNGGFAGVNGSYFCPASYSECASKTNSFDFPVYNSRLGKWINGGNLSWNSRAMVYFDGSGIHYIQNASSFSGGLSAGIVNSPGLLDNGNVQIDDNQSGLSDKQKAAGTKMGIGVVGTRRALVVMASGVNMQQFAYVFKALGASGAMNLDSGGSTALYYNGAYKAGPGRDLPNTIIFAK